MKTHPLTALALTLIVTATAARSMLPPTILALMVVGGIAAVVGRIKQL